MIQVVEFHFKVIIYFITNRKCEFNHVNKATIQVVEWHLRVIFASLQAQNSTLVMSRKRCF